MPPRASSRSPRFVGAAPAAPGFDSSPRLDTTAPLHHTDAVRLTVNLDPDLYAVAVSLAKAEDCSISTAVNRLLRRAAGRRRA